MICVILCFVFFYPHTVFELVAPFGEMDWVLAARTLSATENPMAADRAE